MKRDRIVIIGASLAGATAAATLRDGGFEGDIILVGAESRLPYNRPPLSKGYLRGQDRFDDQLVKPEDYYAGARIELRLGVPVTSIDPGRKTVALADGERLGYDKLLVTTGSRNRRLEAPGADLPGLYQLRTVEDSDRIRDAAKRARRAALIGFGFIGCEVAASLRQLGLEVAVVEGHRVPLARALGPEVGAVLRDIHRDRGVELVLEDAVAALEGQGRVERVRTKNGRVLECDFAVAGIGVVPNAELLAAAGAGVDNGILVDEHCRTSLPDVYAAGDVANHMHPLFGRLRVEHWNHGDRHGRAAGRTLLGDDAPYDYVHSFWSDQYEHVVEYVGFARSWDRLVFRGRPESRKFLAFYMKDGVVAAVSSIDRGGDPEDPRGDSELKVAVDLIRRRVPANPDELADEAVDLRRLVPESDVRPGA
ncbi:MAG TPA: FAD-dependent oxidoreductase [Methylomirabilota bacterium]|nr:FAD-dependent oxidoreductase [Methylomirabilota bacterium]